MCTQRYLNLSQNFHKNNNINNNAYASKEVKFTLKQAV